MTTAIIDTDVFSSAESQVLVAASGFNKLQSGSSKS